MLRDYYNYQTTNPDKQAVEGPQLGAPIMYTMRTSEMRAMAAATCLASDLVCEFVTFQDPSVKEIGWHEISVPVSIDM